MARIECSSYGWDELVQGQIGKESKYFSKCQMIGYESNLFQLESILIRGVNEKVELSWPSTPEMETSHI